MLADVRVDIDVALFANKTLFANFPPLLPGLAPVERNAAFLVGNHHFHTVAQNCFLERLPPCFPVRGVAAHHVDPLPEHRFRHAVNALPEGRLANDVHIHARCRLVAGHRGRGVIEDDVGDVLALFERVGNPQHAGVEKS